MGLRRPPWLSVRDSPDTRKDWEMRKASMRLVLATGVYAAFMAAFLLLRHGCPGGIASGVIASVIYVSIVSIFLRRQTT